MAKSFRHKEFMRVVESLIKKKLKEIPQIELIILGGSVARGDETEHSDIDINFFAKKNFLPEEKRKFYKYLGKYIEESYLPVEDFKLNDLHGESLVLFDKNNLTKKRKTNKSEKEKNTIFLKKWNQAKKYFSLAERKYKKKQYDSALLHLIGTKSLAFILVHSLPERFDLPFPSFRLFDSIKKVGKKLKNRKIFEYTKMIYQINNSNSELILSNFEKIYRIMGKCYKNKHPVCKNWGFYDPIKIKYNIQGLRITFSTYPKEYALRFIIGCIMDWSLGSEDLWKIKENKKYWKKVTQLTKEILGEKEFDEKLAKKKLEITRCLKKEIEKSLLKI